MPLVLENVARWVFVRRYETNIGRSEERTLFVIASENSICNGNVVIEIIDGRDCSLGYIETLQSFSLELERLSFSITCCNISTLF